LNISYQAGAPRIHLRLFDGGRFNLIQLGRSACISTQILALRDFLYLTASHKVSQAYTAKKIVNLRTQVTPQVVSQAGIARMAITQTLATCCIDRLVDRVDHLRDLNALHVTSQLVTTTRPPHARHQITATQLGEQLL
jgi:hypothetical protein